MTVHDVVQSLCTIVSVGLLLTARDRLRMNEPKVRIALGGIGIILAIPAFLAVMGLLRRSRELDFSSVADVTAFGACSLFGGLLVLSLVEIGGGTVQAIKRRRHYRRNVS